jgi:hypothetical protein
MSLLYCITYAEVNRKMFITDVNFLLSEIDRLQAKNKQLRFELSIEEEPHDD